MEIKTKLTEMLGIKYPIIQGCMQWFATAETLAHLVCLETRGRLKNRMDEKGMSLYSCI